MRINKTVIALALTTAFLSACSSTGDNDPGLINSGQSGVIDASIDGYNPNNAAINPYKQNGTTTTSGYNTTAPYDPLLQGTNNSNITATDRLSAGVFGSKDQNSVSNTTNNNAIATSSSKNIIYFMYDSSQVQPQFIPVINKYSEYLRAHSDQIIILEGHADERGSREYNIALGEERAKSVARMMEAKGVFKGQLEIMSYGEEKPASSGHNEAAWQLNRRVKLIYQRTNK
ncbi:MAG: peptidoglycan-associated lipoprotein Pal [Methylococcaceae bacterium]|nr:peptidoglycan-associated lipoprotein Pal [Methylococcaceae bacterium]